jgi:hypothetical protein
MIEASYHHNLCFLFLRIGQRLHTFHMVVLPLIPIFILIAQNGMKYGNYVLAAAEITRVQEQVREQKHTSLKYYLNGLSLLLCGCRSYTT